jgi:membrane-bound metal-dependent hydrolase YbcI (DUF457 family)
MNGPAHHVAGFGAGLAFAQLTNADPVLGVLYIGLSTSTSMWLDLDQKIPFLEHRKETHRPVTCALMVGLVVFLIASYVHVDLRPVVNTSGYPSLATIVGTGLSLGLGSHLVLDGFTRWGIQVIWPLSSGYYGWLPRDMRINTESAAGKTVQLAVTLAMAGVILLDLIWMAQSVVPTLA